MKRLPAVLRLLACVLLGAALAAPARAADVLVFAAASLREALDEHARRFEAATGHRVVVSYAATSALARQVEARAPAHVFISADQEWMRHLEQRNLVVAGSRIDLVGNRLVLIAPAASDGRLGIANGFPLAAALGHGRLAIAHPDSVPAGKYARSALEALGVWPDVQRRVARADNVRGALALVARGEAPFGIVYASDARAEPRVRVVDVFPAATHAPIVYPAALIAGRTSPAAQPLLDYLRSAAARDVWQKRGFSPIAP